MWTRNDLSWLAANYPALPETQPSQIEGNLTFKMLRAGGQYLVNPSDSLVLDASPPDHLYISDTYKVRITWPKDEPYPKAHEVGGKLAKTAKRLSKSLLDMHQYEQDGALCLAAAMDLERTFRSGFNLDVFIEELLIPYLFAQSYYAKNQTWLWGELMHGSLGLIEWLGRQDDNDGEDVRLTLKHIQAQNDNNEIMTLLRVRPRGHRPCFCDSGKKMRDCHADVQRGIIRLRMAMNKAHN